MQDNARCLEKASKNKENTANHPKVNDTEYSFCGEAVPGGSEYVDNNKKECDKKCEATIQHISCCG